MNAADLRAAAALAAPSADAPVATGSPPAVVGILRGNKVPLVELGEAARASRGPAWVLDSPAWREAVERERREREALEAELRPIARRFHERGIDGVLIKSAGGVPYRSSNVDLLVRPSRMREASEILSGLGHLLFPHYVEDRKLLFRLFKGGRSAVCIHLHEAVSWGRILILDGDAVVDRAAGPAGVEGWRLPSPEDLLVTTLAHSLYETDEVRLSDLRAVRLSASAASLDWERVVARVERHGWKAGFYSMLRIVEALERRLWGASVVPRELLEGERARAAASRWSARRLEGILAAIELSAAPVLPHPIPRRYTKLHYLVRLLSSPERSGDERLADFVFTAWNLLANRLRLRCRPAALISVSGLDGSGKSTVVEAVRDAMTLCEVPVGVVWSRGGFTPWMTAAKRAARAAMPEAIPGPGQTEAKHRWLAGSVAGTLFAAAVVVEQSLHYLLRVSAPRLAGWSIVCDRFVFDTEADLEAKLGSGRRIGRAAGAAVAGLAPRPDLAILLSLPAEEAARRKPEDVRAGTILRSRAATLERLAAAHGLVVVEADRPLDAVAAEVVDLSLRACFARFRGTARP